MTKAETQEGRAWFTMLAGPPAIIGWTAYGLAWLLGPRLPVPADLSSGQATPTGTYYLIAAFIAFGPMLLVGL